jgi:hypothetical protein
VIPSDTSPKIAAMQIEVLRKKSPADRLLLVCSLSEMVNELSMRNCEATVVDPFLARLEWIKNVYGKEFSRKVSGKLRAWYA